MAVLREKTEFCLNRSKDRQLSFFFCLTSHCTASSLKGSVRWSGPRFAERFAVKKRVPCLLQLPSTVRAPGSFFFVVFFSFQICGGRVNNFKRFLPRLSEDFKSRPSGRLPSWPRRAGSGWIFWFVENDHQIRLVFGCGLYKRRKSHLKFLRPSPLER